MVARFGEVDGPRFSPKFDLRSAASDKMRTVEKLTSSRVYEIRAQWDSEAGVWVAESEDVPGLVAEANFRLMF